MTTDPFAPILAASGVVVLDGGLATALEARGHSLHGRLWSARLLRDDPDAVVDVHRRFLEAGADCITTASYQASFPGFAEAGFGDGEAAELLLRSSALALSARDAFVQRGGRGGPEPLVAASIGPYGAYLADGSEYDGRYAAPDAELRAFHERRLGLLAGSGVDLLACETVPSGREVAVLLDLLATLPPSLDVRAWLSVSCRDGGHLYDGTPIEDVAALCAGAGRVVAVGVNCTAPRYVPELVRRLRAVGDGLVVAYPNSGETYDAASGSWSRGPRAARADVDEWLEGVIGAHEAGAEIVGGCCRVGPEGISELRRRLAG